MLGSATFYVGVMLGLAGLALMIRPIPRLGITTRLRASLILYVGVAVAVIGLLAPTSESRMATPRTRLDEFAPAWQFNEFHSLRVNAPPERVYAAMKSVRANEIFLFRALTWIRRGGRPLPESILNAGDREPLIDVALRGGFVLLAEDAPREFVMGTVVHKPVNARDTLSADLFRVTPPGYAVAAMNFLVTPDGPNASVVTTETRVFANGAAARRKFAAYWRLIYPGSALIRVMWLRAIRRRATTPN